MNASDKNRLHIHEYCFELFVSQGEVQLKFPCTFFITWKTGKHTTQDIESVSPEGNLIPFNSHLELVSEVAYNQLTQSYLEKRSFISVYLNSLCRNNTPKLVGVVSLDLSQCLNNNTYDKPKQYRIERCPDKQSHLTFYVKSRFNRELGRDEIRDMSFSFQNEIDQQIARRESTAGDEARPSFHTGDRSHHDRRSALPSDFMTIPPLRREDKLKNEQKAASRDKDLNTRTSRHHRDLAGSIARSHRVEIQQEKPTSIRASFKKSTADPGIVEGQKISVRSSNPSQQQIGSNHHHISPPKKQREKWITQMESNIINRRNELKESVIKDYVSRHQQECDELKVSLESQKSFRLKLEAELENVRIECTNYKIAQKELERKLHERPAEQEHNVVRKLRESLMEAEKKMLQANETIDAITEELKHIKEQNSHLKERINGWKVTNELEGRQNDNLAKELQSVRQQLSITLDEKTKAEAELDAYRRSTLPTRSNVKHEQLSPLRDKLDQTERLLTEERQLNVGVRHQLRMSEQNQQVLKTKLSMLEERQSEFREKHVFLESLYQTSRDSIRLLEEENAQLQKMLTVKTQTIEQLNKDLEALVKNIKYPSTGTPRNTEQKLRAKLQLYEKDNTLLKEALLHSEHKRAEGEASNEDLQQKLLELLQDRHEKELTYQRDIGVLTAQMESYRGQLEQFQTYKQTIVGSIPTVDQHQAGQQLQQHSQGNTPLELSYSEPLVLQQIDRKNQRVSVVMIMREEFSTQTEDMFEPIKSMVEIEVQTEKQHNIDEPSEVLAFPSIGQPSKRELLIPPTTEPQQDSIIEQFSVVKSVVTVPITNSLPVMTVEEHNTRVQEYELRILQLEKCLEKIGELNEENVQLQVRADEYQQQAWNLRASLQNELFRNANMSQTIEELKQALETLRRCQQKQHTVTVSQTNEQFAALKFEIEELRRKNELLVGELEISQLTANSLKDQLAQLETSYNELFERLREKDEKERTQEQAIIELEKKLFETNVSKQEALNTSLVLQKTDFKGGKVQSIVLEDFASQPPSPTKIINQPNNYEDHPAIKMNPLLSQIHSLAKRLSHTSKQFEETATERDDRELIVKYLEDQVAKLHSRIQLLQQDLFVAKAEIVHGEKHRSELLEKLKGRDYKALSNALSIQVIQTQLENRRLGDKLRRSNTMVGKPINKIPITDTFSCKEEEQMREQIIEESIRGPSEQKDTTQMARTKQFDLLNEQIARRTADANSKDIRIEELTQKVQSLEQTVREYEQTFSKNDQQPLSPIRQLEIPSTPELPSQADKLQEEVLALRKEREVYVRIIEHSRQKELQAEANQTQHDQLLVENDELRRQCNHLERLNAELRSEIDLQREELLGSRITLSPIGKSVAENFQQGGQEWENQTNGLHQLLVTLTTRNRLLMERLRALSSERTILQTSIKQAVEETQRLTARILSNTVSVEQKKEAMKQVRPLTAKLQEMLQVIGSCDPNLLVDQSEDQSMDSIAKDSEFDS